MNINKSELEAVAVKPNQYPPEGVAEIAFAGRSNVGKSSLLNLLTEKTGSCQWKSGENTNHQLLPGQ